MHYLDRYMYTYPFLITLDLSDPTNISRENQFFDRFSFGHANIYALALSPNNKYFYCASDYGVLIYPIYLKKTEN